MYIPCDVTPIGAILKATTGDTTKSPGHGGFFSSVTESRRFSIRLKTVTRSKASRFKRNARHPFCRAQRSGARLGNRDVAPVAAFQSRPRERQMYVTVLVPGGPAESLSHEILLGVSKYVSDRANYF